MKILLASQRLACPKILKKLKEEHPDCDMCIDLGRYEPGWMGLTGAGDLRIYGEGHGIYVTYGTQTSCRMLALKAKEAGCDLLLWGQNPNAWIVEIEDVLFVSPGCVDHCSASSLPPSYARIDLEKGLFPKAEIEFHKTAPMTMAAPSRDIPDNCS